MLTVSWRKFVHIAASIALLLGATVASGLQKSTAAPIGDGTRVLKIASGGTHSLALLNDGSVSAWGKIMSDKQTCRRTLGMALSTLLRAGSFLWRSKRTVPSSPGVGCLRSIESADTGENETSKIVAIESGFSHSLALKDDGTVVAWGSQKNDQVPVEAKSGVASIAAGMDISLALKTDGTVVAWNDTTGRLGVPSGVQGGITAISAGYSHFLALKADGSVVGWKSNNLLSVPEQAQSDVIAISAGYDYSLALKADGRVVAWGTANELTNVPEAAESGVVAIAAGGDQALALKADGTLVVWHMAYNQEAKVPGKDALESLMVQEGSSISPLPRYPRTIRFKSNHRRRM